MENIGDYVNNAKIESSLGHARPLNDEEKAAFCMGMCIEWLRKRRKVVYLRHSALRKW